MTIYCGVPPPQCLPVLLLTVLPMCTCVPGSTVAADWLTEEEQVMKKCTLLRVLTGVTGSHTSLERLLIILVQPACCLTCHTPSRTHTT